MASPGQGSKRLAGAIGLSLGAVLLGALVRTGTASALCGPAGPAGAYNTVCGTGTLAHDTTGANDSAFGFNALHSNATGGDNTANGEEALSSNTTGYNNTASGANALQFNTTGSQNSAFGSATLLSNTTGIDNTASGFFALHNNITGFENTASGGAALYSNTTGYENTASGAGALESNAFGNDNTASGAYALYSNTGDRFGGTGNSNTASGAYALYSNTTGFQNTASGDSALFNITTGNGNIGIGYSAGNNIVAGSNNIEIGGAGTADESNTIRIGTQGTQHATFIAGISGTPITGADVVVSSTGQLGIATSSARYKRDIRDIGGASAGLMKLRPVSFRYKSDPGRTLQYGLVAEEVARVYPELVTRGTDGKLQSVRYLEFTALLLNELQRQAKETRQLADALKQKDATINALSERLAALEHQARTANADGLRSLAWK